MKPKKVTIICSKCGKEPELDKKNSNDNWTAYKTGDCKCGGVYKFNFKS